MKFVGSRITPLLAIFMIVFACAANAQTSLGPPAGAAGLDANLNSWQSLLKLSQNKCKKFRPPCPACKKEAERHRKLACLLADNINKFTKKHSFVSARFDAREFLLANFKDIEKELKDERRDYFRDALPREFAEIKNIYAMLQSSLDIVFLCNRLRCSLVPLEDQIPVISQDLWIEISFPAKRPCKECIKQYEALEKIRKVLRKILLKMSRGGRIPLN